MLPVKSEVLCRIVDDSSRKLRLTPDGETSVRAYGPECRVPTTDEGQSMTEIF